MINKMPDYLTTVVLDSVGEKTKTRWYGSFKVKAVLSHGDQLLAARTAAELLKGLERDINNELVMRGETIAQLQPRVVDAPDWWWASGGGRNLVDAEPLYALLGLCSRASEDWEKQLDVAANSGESGANVQNNPKP